MDDVFVVFHSDEKATFFQHVNAVDLNIHLTQVNISDNKLSLLDCLVTIDTDRTLSVAAFQNDTHKDQYLNFHTNHPLHQKLGFAKTVTHI